MKKFILSAMTGLVLFTSCKKEISCEGCKATNKAPIANAGANQSILLPADSVLLDGSASLDPDGSITGWNWTKISGPASFTFSIATVVKPVVKNLVPGVYQFELTVNDIEGLSAKDTVQITITGLIQSNRPPVAKAGVDKSITLPVNQTDLNGNTSSDPDNNIAVYAWMKISGPSSYNIVAPNSSQTQVTNLVAGIYLFELTITDAGNLFSKDTMQLIVNPIAVPPPVTASYTFDITFDLQPVCSISYDTAHGYYSLLEKDFFLDTNSDSSFPGSAKLSASIYQMCHIPTNNCSTPVITIYEPLPGSSPLNHMKFDILSGTSNFFTLLYTNGRGEFSGTATAVDGAGRFINLSILSSINFSGFADTTNHTGKIRLHGTINF